MSIISGVYFSSAARMAPRRQANIPAFQATPGMFISSRARISVGFSSKARRGYARTPSIRWACIVSGRRYPNSVDGRLGEMPSVTSGSSMSKAPVARRPVATLTMSRNASSRSIHWSAGRTSMTSASGRSMTAVARAIAAAVFRPFGSTISPTVGTWSRTSWPKRRSVTQKMSSSPTSGAIRRTVRWRSDSSPSSGKYGLGRSGRLSGQSRVPPPPARITTYMGPGIVGPAGSADSPGDGLRRSEAGRGHAEQDDRGHGAVVDARVSEPRRVGDRVAGVEDVAIVAHPQLDRTFEHEDDLLIRIVGVGLRSGPAARRDRADRHLDSARPPARQEFVDGAETRILDPAALAAADDPTNRRLFHEELRDCQPERPGDPLDRGDRRAGDLALDLREEALRDAGDVGQLAEGHRARLTQRPDPHSKLKSCRGQG